MSNTKDKDRLTTLPAKLLIKIIADVPLSSFLDLTQTCRYLRHLIKDNAKEICNKAIEARFPLHTKYLHPVKKRGWLTHSLYYLHSWEQRAVVKRKSERIFTDRESWDYKWDYKIKLTQPGPQYLAFLESDVVVMTIDKGMRGRENNMERFLKRVNGPWVKALVWVREMVIVDRRMMWYYGAPKFEKAMCTIVESI
jgi:hypothetical protein